MRDPVRVFAAAIVLLAGGIVTNGQVKGFRPVTDAMLSIPTPATGPTGAGRSTAGATALKQITTQNVHQIQLAWSWGSRRAQPADAAGVERRCSCRARAAAFRRRRRQRRPARDAGEAGRRRAPRLADGNLAVYDDKVYIAGRCAAR
jgi:hypothetical protein